jgi:fructose/tagatose bisphosphate aldolase
MIYKDVEELRGAIKGIVQVNKEGTVTVLDEKRLKEDLIDDLIYNAVLNPDPELVKGIRWLIRRIGSGLGIIPSSIQDLYQAIGEKKVTGFTVPAINIRGLTFDVARAVLRAALKNKVGAVIFEIARSEIGYTYQRPSEYASCIIAAAIKEDFQGPLFLQGDHFQVNAKRYAKDAKAEVGAAKDLIREGIEAGFYNIDVDTSTLVDLSKPTTYDQQRLNFDVAAELTAYIRQLEPEGISVSVGGEIGEIGGKNSTVEELKAFMDGYLESLQKKGKGIRGISKIAVQTGTTHGGVPLPDGSVAKVKLDFETLEDLSRAARDDYGLSGAVQHGASTLPDEAFDRFPKTGAAEIHLATGFQNMIYDSEHFPSPLRDMIYDYIRKNLSGEKKEGQTDEQFIYKTRKKGFGPFKRELWDLSSDIRSRIGNELEAKFDFLFKKLNVGETDRVVKEYVKPKDIISPAPLDGLT